MDFKQKYGPCAIVTGASSGIGESFAHSLAMRGLRLVLTGRDAQRLAMVQKAIAEKTEFMPEIFSFDLANEKETIQFSKIFQERECGLLINNAGYGLSGPYLSNNSAEHSDLFRVNLLAPALLSHAFALSVINKNRKGGIINIASIVAYQPTPYMASYGAAKAGILSLGEALGYEWKGAIDVLTVSPGPVNTRFFERAGMRQILADHPDRIAEHSLKKLGRRSVFVPGFRNLLSTTVAARLPRSWSTALAGISMKMLGRDKKETE